MLAGVLSARAVAAERRLLGVGEVDRHLVRLLAAALAGPQEPGAVGRDAEGGELPLEPAGVGGDARVWDTRKTIPGLRALSKAAVRAGGGRNHRGNLSDWILIKDNHLGGVGITAAVTAARDRWPGRTVHVECDSLDQCVEALDAGADSILLDNMSPAEVRDCVAAARARQGGHVRRTLLEVSGEVTLDTIGEYAGTGVDMISVGRITKSAPTLDIGLDLF